MKAKELLRCYRQGDRKFCGVNLKGESLRGMNLEGIDLSGANLIKTDLRGTRFVNAILIDAQFCEARTGTQEYWTILFVLLSLLLSALTADLLASLIFPFITALIHYDPSVFSSSRKIVEIVVGTFTLAAGTAALISNYNRGISDTLNPNVGTVTITDAFVIAIVGTFSVVFAVPFAVAIAIAGFSVVAVAGISAFVFTGLIDSFTTPLASISTATLVLSCAFFNFVISRRALMGDPRDELIRDLAVGLSSLRGTSFCGADLTRANFSCAIIESAHFRGAKLTHSCFRRSKRLYLSRAYKTILSDRTVLDLLVSRRSAADKSYAGINLQGANLEHADLADINLTEANLNNATLEDADMQRAILSKVQARSTKFHRTKLTAACIKDWSIDSNAQLDDVICEYIYLWQDRQERRPKSGTFAKGELAKLFEESLSTSELISRDSKVKQEIPLQPSINVNVTNTTSSTAMQGNDQSQNFHTGGNLSINANNSVVSLRDISGHVSNQINQLGGGATQTQLKDLLTQLQTAIKTEPALSEDEKTEALKEVGTIAEAGQTLATDSGQSQKLAKRAMNTLKGMTAGLTETTKLVEVCNRLLPAIGLLFGL